MKTKSTILLFVTFFLTFFLNAQNYNNLSQKEIREMNRAIQADTNLATIFSWFGEPLELYQAYKKNLMITDSIWRNDQKSLEKFTNIGETERFELIPLVECFKANNSLAGDDGISYLVKTDSSTILVDLGLNKNNTHPSPLLQNMEKLGYSIDEIDYLVITHDHSDHVGGHKWWKKQSFSFTKHQIELDSLTVLTPIEMQYLGLSTNYTPYPTKISKGVATIGVIQKPVLFLNIVEQAIAFNVKNKGIVIISGCGHQSVPKIIQRSKVLFDEPLYGLLGGFHYPLVEGRNIDWMYKYFVADKLPWERLTVDDVNENIKLLKSNGVKIVGVSGHDSCDQSIELFKKEFGENYFDIIAGQKITLNE